MTLVLCCVNITLRVIVSLGVDMKEIEINDAKPGMVLGADVFSIRGQTLADKGDVLSAHMIMHLGYYGVRRICIEEQMQAPPDDPASYLLDTYYERIRNSQEFKEFKADYTSAVKTMKNHLSDFILRQEPLQSQKILDGARRLWERKSTTVALLDMLHNMHELDDITYTHSMNVGIISRVIGEWIGYKGEELDNLTLAGMLHDVGKSVIPNEIIEKPGALSSDEFEMMKKHPQYGHEMLKNQKLDRKIKLAALQHHERCDGTGYPMGLTSDEIEPTAMMIAIADVYDAMTANRTYRAGMCPFDVVAEFESTGLQRFHPQFILIFLQHIAEAYVGADVLLSNGKRGRVAMIDQNHLSRPLIRLQDGTFIKLADEDKLFIQAVI